LKQIVILSGKGGTGKTSVAAALAHLAATRYASSSTGAGHQFDTVLVDADVDASNLELVLSPQVLETHEFQGGQIAIIDEDLCDGCGRCAELCRFDAIAEQDNVYTVDPIACEGCALCFYQCPMEAIRMEEQMAGRWFRSPTRYGPLMHAVLLPAQENSGKLVTLVKQQGRLLAMDDELEFVLVDGHPGIGCPVISAAAGADLALIVAEPTAAGIHDMDRALATTDHFGIRSLVCINKTDLYPKGVQEIESYCEQKGVPVVGWLPFDTIVTEAMIQGQPVTAFSPDSSVSEALRTLWDRVLAAVNDNEVEL